MNWDRKTLGEIYEIEGGSVQTGPFGSQLHESDYKEIGIPVIMPKDIIDDKLDLSGIAYISDDDAKRLSQHIVRKNDIVCPRRGEIGKRIIIDDKSVGAFCGTGCIRLRGTGSLLNQLFLFNYLKQPRVVKWIENQAIGATMMNLNTSILKSIPIKFPPLPIQTKIASILSSYDELIENNNQRIKLLEQMAEEIYKEWFVRLRFPGYETAKFYNKQGLEVNQDKAGALPEDWKICEFEDFVDVSDGTHDSPKNSIYGYPLVTGKNIKNGFIDLSDTYLISQDDHDKIQKRSHLSPGDIIVSNIGTIGSTAMIFKQPNFSVKNVIIIRPQKSSASNYIYTFIKSNNTQLVFQNEMSGASQQFLSLSYMRKFKILVPSQIVLSKFEKIVGELYRLENLLFDKNQLLQQTRDLLLPRLLSGKLSVEHLIEEVVHLPMAAEPEVKYKEQ